MEKILIFIAAVCVLGGVNSLQCYRCTNCTEVKSEQLVTCGSNTTATTTTSTTTQKPTVSTTSTIVSTTSTTVSTSTTTTAKPANTTTNANSTTTAPTNTTASSTTTTTTTTSPVPSNETSSPAPSNETQVNPETLRVRRSAEQNYDENCFCNNDGECNCHGLRIIQFADEKATESSYVCVKDTVQVNGATIINRGCAVKHNQTQQTCVGSAFSSNCAVCDTDKCNNAVATNLSVLVLAASFFAALKLV